MPLLHVMRLHVLPWIVIIAINFIRWLQPDQSIDPSASDLELVNAKETPMVGKLVQLVVRTCDQEKETEFVEGMNVSTGLGIRNEEKLVYNVYVVCNETILKYTVHL